MNREDVQTAPSKVTSKVASSSASSLIVATNRRFYFYNYKNINSFNIIEIPSNLQEFLYTAMKELEKGIVLDSRVGRRKKFEHLLRCPVSRCIHI